MRECCLVRGGHVPSSSRQNRVRIRAHCRDRVRAVPSVLGHFPAVINVVRQVPREVFVVGDDNELEVVLLPPRLDDPASSVQASSAAGAISRCCADQQPPALPSSSHSLHLTRCISLAASHSLHLTRYSVPPIRPHLPLHGGRRTAPTPGPGGRHARCPGWWLAHRARGRRS